VRSVTNEQQRRRTLFKPTLWAVASWLIFCVIHSSRPAPVSRWRHGTQISRGAKLALDARRYRQSGSDRPEKPANWPTAVSLLLT